MHETKVTPFIDVIFVYSLYPLIATPLATVHISFDLPSANA